MEKQPQVLIIDDDIDFANYIFDVAQTLKIHCKATNNANDFMNALTPEITLVFLDLNIPKIDGIELLRYIKINQFKCNIILMSGVDIRVLDTAKELAQSLGLTVVGQFQKPIHLVDLENLLRENTNKKDVHTEDHPILQNPMFEITKDELIQAIKNNNFILHYQPKITIATGKLYGVEALVRWLHPKHHLIFPDQFISLFESYGLIDEISWLVIKNAVKDFEFINCNINFPFLLSLNLSPYFLHDLTFPDKFIDIINQSSIDPENIIFEITETELLKDLSNALDILTRLRLKKFQLSIDDFGTGYAMMQQLKLIPANELKIDKSFVQNLLKENSARVVVKKSIEIGHELGMKVVAEGVETKEHLQFLKDNQCDIGQGHYFSKPLSIPELLHWIEVNYTVSEIN